MSLTKDKIAEAIAKSFEKIADNVVEGALPSGEDGETEDNNNENNGNENTNQKSSAVTITDAQLEKVAKLVSSKIQVKLEKTDEERIKEAFEKVLEGLDIDSSKYEVDLVVKTKKKGVVDSKNEDETHVSKIKSADDDENETDEEEEITDLDKALYGVDEATKMEALNHFFGRVVNPE
jgi:hypothetical protein